MRCEEVQEQLSGYLEKLLDPAQSRSIDGHLASCPRCTSELADLAQCRRLVAALPMVEPPVGFTTRVMAHIREAEQQPSWWQRLLLPLRMKRSLPVAALVLISVMSVLLLQREKPQEQLSHSLSEPSQTEALKRSADAASQFSAESADLLVKPLPAPSGAAEKAWSQAEAPQAKLQEANRKAPAPVTTPPQADAKGPAPVKSAARAAAPAALPSAVEERANTVEFKAAEAELPPTPSRPIAGAIGVSQPAGGRAAPASPSMDAIMPERVRAPLPERSRPAPSQPSADIEIVLRRHPQPAGEPRDSVEPLRKEAEPRLRAPNISALTSPRAAAQPVSEPLPLQSVPADRYEQFKKELSAQGTIVSETMLSPRESDAAPKANQILTIKVTVLPAEAAR